MARTGLQLGLLWRSVNFNDLVFGDQIENGTTGSLENLDTDNVFKPIAAVGGALYHEFMWMGVAVHHFNQPVLSSSGQASRLTARLNAHFGMKLPVAYSSTAEVFFLPALLYQRQGQADQLDTGATLRYNQVAFGVNYRGLPVIKNTNGLAQQSVGFALGIHLNDWRIGYSYDWGVSSEIEAVGDSHEITLVFDPPAK